MESTAFILKFMLENTVGSTELSSPSNDSIKMLQTRVGWLARCNSSSIAVEQFANANGIPAY